MASPVLPLAAVPLAPRLPLRRGTAPLRRGTALTMAMLILFALLLLGLPFLFSMASSGSGSRAFAERQLAAAGADQAVIWGAELAAQANGRIFATGSGQAHSSLFDDLRAYSAAASVAAVRDLQFPPHEGQPGVIQVVLPQGGTASGSVVGLTISDESGKLDPNFLSVAAWDALLTRVLRRPNAPRQVFDPTTGDDVPVGSAHDVAAQDPAKRSRFINPDWDDGNGDWWRIVRPGDAIPADYPQIRVPGLAERVVGKELFALWPDTDPRRLRLGEPAPVIDSDDSREHLNPVLVDDGITPIGSGDNDLVLTTPEGTFAGTLLRRGDPNAGLALPGLTNNGIAVNDDNDDPDRYGELARALSLLPLLLPGQRITDLDQLLLADPGHNAEASVDDRGVAAFGYGIVQKPVADAQGTVSPRSGAGRGFGFRRPLTRAELEALKPYLTLHHVAQGRSGGLNDLGTVVDVASNDGSRNDGSAVFLDAPIDELVGVGTRVQAQVGGAHQGSPATAQDQSSHVVSQVSTPPRTAVGQSPQLLRTYAYEGGAQTLTFAKPGAGVAIAMPPTVNLHAASDAVRMVVVANHTARFGDGINRVGTGANGPSGTPEWGYDDGLLRSDDGVTPQGWIAVERTTTLRNRGKSLGPGDDDHAGVKIAHRNWTNSAAYLGSDGLRREHLGLSAFDLLDPLSSRADFFWASDWQPALNPRALPRMEMPAIDIAGSGVVTIHAMATGQNAAGQPTRTAGRAFVVQAVPQESVLEKRWQTQDDFHALIAQRQGNGLTSGPIATERFARQDMVGDLAATNEQTFNQQSLPSNGPGWLQARPLPSLATGWRRRFEEAPGLSHLSLDWQLPFGAVIPARRSSDMARCTILHAVQLTPSALPPFGSQQPLITGPVVSFLGDAARLTPDGFSLAGTQGGLAYRVNVGNGPLRSRQAASGGTSVNPELASRQLSFWVTPTTDWTKETAPVCLFSVSCHPDFVGVEADGRRAPVNEQNFFGLYYDPQFHGLILVHAPPTVPQRGAMGPVVQQDDLRTPLIDELCLPQGRTARDLVPQQRADSDVVTLVSSLLTPNRRAVLYKLGNGYVAPRKAMHIQVVLAGDRPGQTQIIVDGVVGQDALNMEEPAVTRHGDFLHMPVMRLARALPGVDLSVSGPSSLRDVNLGIIKIATATAVVQLGANSLMPALGIIRVDDEYLQYAGTFSSLLLDPTRGVRQDSDSDDANPSNNAIRFPVTQAHAEGALVTPGGLRTWIPPLSGTASAPHIYRGGLTLQSSLPAGSPSPDGSSGVVLNGRWCVWSALSPGQRGATTDLRLATPTALPEGRGIFRIRGDTGEAFVAARVDVTAGFLRDVRPLVGTASAAIGSWQALPTWTRGVTLADEIISIVPSIDTTSGRTAWVELVGLPLSSGAEPSTLNDIEVRLLYPHDMRIALNWTGATHFLMQFTARDGRAEWIRYEQFLEDPSDGLLYLFHRNGFGGGLGNQPATRGQHRTPSPQALNDGYAFAAGTGLLPVQLELPSIGHLLATGDVVTFSPRKLGGGFTPGQLADPEVPVQAVIRYAPVDSYGSVSQIDPLLPPLFVPGVDVHNGLFAFDRPLPFRISDATRYELLIGTCWSATRDLSPHKQTDTLIPGHTPRVDAWQDQAFRFGDPDRESPMIIDSIAAGPWNVPGVTSAGTQLSLEVTACWLWTDLDGPGPQTAFGWLPSLVIPATAAPGDIAVRLSAAITAMDQTKPQNLGLISIAGETMCWQAFQNGTNAYGRPPPPGAPAPPDALAVLVVGRGQLSNDPSLRDHRFAGFPDVSPGPFQATPRGLAALPLPIGPVALVSSYLPAASSEYPLRDRWFSLSNGGFVTRSLPDGSSENVPASIDDFDAPAMLLSSPTGNAFEITMPVGPRVVRERVGFQDVSFSEFTVPTWLRGMYGTNTALSSGGGNPTSPTARPAPNTIAIGWWPRYRSGMEVAGQSVNDTDRQAALRSRAFAYASFPFRLRDALFDPKAIRDASGGALPVAEVTVEDEASAMMASALPGGWDWMQSDLLTLRGAPNEDVSALFSSPTFSAPCDGAELRLRWQNFRPNAFLADVSHATSVTPRITRVVLRARAPMKLLATE